MATALIGSSSFVGANLLAQAHFDVRSDFPAAGEYDLVVCAGAPGEKWRANRDPEGDQLAVRRLMDGLAGLSAKKLLLVSTIDVYGKPEGVDEDSPPEPGSAYGKHRRELEEFCASRFATTIVRLPLLFGPGLDKNVLHDLLIDHAVENIHPDGVFQYYAVGHLWRDANIALERALPLVNFVSAPVATRELALRCLGRELTSYPATPPAHHDVWSKHAPLWGGERYLFAKERILHDIADFIEKERAL
jgi:nucleoside-diphosphate-sugar epimerase